jgi:hypothetical protein
MASRGRFMAIGGAFMAIGGECMVRGGGFMVRGDGFCPSNTFKRQCSDTYIMHHNIHQWSHSWNNHEWIY